MWSHAHLHELDSFEEAGGGHLREHHLPVHLLLGQVLCWLEAAHKVRLCRLQVSARDGEEGVVRTRQHGMVRRGW